MVRNERLIAYGELESMRHYPCVLREGLIKSTYNKPIEIAGGLAEI
jgi:hypothetical protein